MYKPSAKLRVTLKRAGNQYTVVLGATLYTNGELFCGSPLREGGELARSSYHRDGVIHTYLLKRREARSEQIKPAREREGPMLLGSWSGGTDAPTLRWKQWDKNWTRPESRMILLDASDLPGDRLWSVDLWVLGSKYAEGVDGVLAPYRRGRMRLIEWRHIDWSQPQLLAAVWYLDLDPTTIDPRMRRATAVTTNQSGSILVSYEGEPDVDLGTPYGRVDMSVSADGGDTWSVANSVDEGGTNDWHAPIVLRDIFGRTHVCFEGIDPDDRRFKLIQF